MHKHVLCVAHTGVAATLLCNGATVHSTFGLPLLVEQKMESKIDLASNRGKKLALHYVLNFCNLAEQLKSAKVILWDEAPMTDKRIFACIDRFLRVLHPDIDSPFGGVMVIAGGDWKQILPIVPNVN